MQMAKTKLRCLLKQNGEHYSIYMVILNENRAGKKSIFIKMCDEYWHDYFGRDLVKTHLNYPQDGNLHSVFKYKNNNVEQYVTGYYSKIKYKEVVRGKKSKESSQTTKNVINLFVKDNTISLDQYTNSNKLFQFPLISIPIPTQNTKLFKSSHPKSKDMIIDSDTLSQGTLNVSSYLCGNHFDHSKLITKEAYYLNTITLPCDTFQILLLAKFDRIQKG